MTTSDPAVPVPALRTLLLQLSGDVACARDVHAVGHEPDDGACPDTTDACRAPAEGDGARRAALSVLRAAVDGMLAALPETSTRARNSR